MDIHAGAHGGQPALGAGHLEARQDLLLGAVPLEFRVGRICRRAVDEVGQARFQRPESGLERVEAKSLDARSTSNGERPVGYERWSIGT